MEKMKGPDRELKVLRWVCPQLLLEEIEGDLVQRFERDLKKHGERIARRKLWWNTLRFFRPEIVLRNKIRLAITPFFMIRNYIKIALRNFQKQKAYTFLNIVGLSLGVAASLLIFQYVKYEKSFDRFHSKADQIYRVQYNGWQSGKLNFESAVAVPACGRALKDNFPEVEEFTRLLPVDGVISYRTPEGDERAFYEHEMQYADPGLFSIFDFEMIKGDPKTALLGLDKVVISERTAQKFFGAEEPLGKKLMRNGFALCEVSGVFKNIPENPHLQFDLLFTYESLNKRTNNNSETSWGWYDFYTSFSSDRAPMSNNCNPNGMPM